METSEQQKALDEWQKKYVEDCFGSSLPKEIIEKARKIAQERLKKMMVRGDSRSQ
jgi:hypothetical protein